MQQETFMSEMTAEDRIRTLQETADSIEETEYLKALTPEELDQKREELAEIAIANSRLEDELAEFKERINEKLKPAKKLFQTLLIEIASKQAKCAGTLYHLADYNRGFMDTYNEAGELIGTRRLRPDEKQPNIFVNAPKNA